MQAILFDLDGTLLDRNASIRLYLRDQYRRYDLDHLPYETYRRRFLELDEHGYGDKFKVFQTLITEFAIPATVEEMVADFRRNSWKNCKTFPGTLKVLDQLRSRGYKLGIITNGSVELQQAKLLESGLIALVDIALISEQEQLRKPDPQIFVRAAERLQLSVEACVFVGDNPETDVGGAHSAGMKSVWFKGDLPWPDFLEIAPSHTVSTLAELLAVEF